MVRFKLDENTDPAWGAPLTQEGHEVKSVPQQSLPGCPVLAQQGRGTDSLTGAPSRPIGPPALRWVRDGLPRCAELPFSGMIPNGRPDRGRTGSRIGE